MDRRPTHPKCSLYRSINVLLLLERRGKKKEYIEEVVYNKTYIILETLGLRINFTLSTLYETFNKFIATKQ